MYFPILVKCHMSQVSIPMGHMVGVFHSVCLSGFIFLKYILQLIYQLWNYMWELT